MDVGNPFIVLGSPRSGTNYLSALIKAHPEVELQIEPFSLHTATFLREDLRQAGAAAEALAGRRVLSFVEDLKTWLSSQASNQRGFKETTLFAKLPLLARWLPSAKVIFIRRQVSAIVRSHLSGHLIQKWRLPERYADHDNPELAARARRALPDADTAGYLVESLVGLRLKYWEQYRYLFDHLEIAYEDLAADPERVLRECMAFLDLAFHQFQRTAIIRRNSGVGRSVYSTFAGTRALSSPFVTRLSSRLERRPRFGKISPTQVTVREAAAFLNGAGIDPRDKEEYLLYNPFNPDLPLYFQAGEWRFLPSNAATPVTGFSLLGALHCCEFLGGRLPTLQEMTTLAEKVGWPPAEAFPKAASTFAICETVDGPQPTGRGSATGATLFGNVAEWCLPETIQEECRCGTDSFPVFGAGWNKDDTYLSRRCYRRWGRTGATSVGFRVAGQ